MTPATQLARVRRMARNGSARAIREEANLSLRDMSSDVGVESSTLWRWEAGVSVPRRDAGLRWLQVLEELA